MGIFSRFADIVNANINALLERAENPQKMVRLIIQEMEDTLVEVRSQSARALADKKELERRIHRLTADAHMWEEKAGLALAKEREDLARKALIEKSRIEDDASQLKNELQLVEENLDKLKADLAQLTTKLNDAKARQRSMVVRKQTADTRLQIRRQLDDDKAQSAMDRFDAYERRIDGVEAEVDSYDLAKEKSLADEFAELEAEDKINSELAALKQKMQQSSTTDNDDK